ncbi:MAG: endonuclease/exonuclease/phosphatase family protein [Bdellovibrionales bacterium]|nr:endonuclease/exonuclease/phosphatase family protein [Bdellovibrionales bacterium]
MKILFVLGILCAALVLAFFWAAGFPQEPAGTREGAILAPESPPAPPPAPHELTLLTWNLSYAYGQGSEGRRFRAKPRDHFGKALESIAATIRASGADIVLLQEIDFGSRRSHHMNQLAALSEWTGLPYAAPAVSWHARWVPFPYWPPSEQFGPVVSGGAVLSRFPITRAQVHLFPRLPEQPWWYRAFYPHRYVQRVDLELGPGRTFTVVNLHLEAFLQEARERQARELSAALSEGAFGDVSVVGGDFNTVPPEASRFRDFNDGTEDAYLGDVTLPLIRDVRGLRETVPVDAYRADESAYFTFPAHAPNRRLDYLFLAERLGAKEWGVVRAAGTVSDHLPFRARVVLP